MINIKGVFKIAARGNLILATDDKHSYKKDDVLVDENGDTYTVVANVTSLLGLNDLYVSSSKENKINNPTKVSRK